MKWLQLVYCILCVNAATCGILAITVTLVRAKEHNNEIWDRWQQRFQQQQRKDTL
jgi:hypothetical protein